MSEDTLRRIAAWFETEDDFDIVDTTITVDGDPPLILTVEVGDNALSLTHTYSVPEPPRGFAEHAAKLLTKRGSMITGEVTTGTSSTDVRVHYPIYLEGLNRQSFLVAIREITGTADGLDQLLAAATLLPDDDAPATASRPAAPPSQADPEPRREPVSAAAPQPAPAPAAQAAAPWAASHQVPSTGMAAWSQPDPSIAPIANLGGGTPLQAGQQRGAWMHVTGSNGWTGWVDARILVPIGSPAAAAPSWSSTPASGSQWAGGAQPQAGRIGVLGLISAALMLFVAFFLHGFDWIPATVWPLDSLASQLAQPRVGFVLIALAALVAAAALVHSVPFGVRVAAGLVAIWFALGTAFFIVDQTSFDWLFSGPATILWMTLVGGVLALIPEEISPAGTGVPVIARGVNPLALAGGFLLLLSPALSWGFGSNGMDWAISWSVWPLTELSLNWNHPTIGLLLLALGLLVVVSATRPRPSRTAPVVLGVIAVVLALGTILGAIINGVAGQLFNPFRYGLFTALIGGLLTLLPNPGRR